MTLTEFLLARIAEDARAAERARATGWLTEHNVQARLIKPCGALLVEFITRHDPDRVLAECDAKRRIVERHEQVFLLRASAYSQDRSPVDQSDEYWGWWNRQAELSIALSALAPSRTRTTPTTRTSGSPRTCWCGAAATG